MKIKLILILLLFVYTACEEEEPVKVTTTLLTLVVDPTYKTAESDNWIIIHDENGNLLEFESFESGDKIIFETEKPVPGNTITVTDLTYSIWESGRNNYHLRTSFNYEKGGEFILKKDPHHVKDGSIIGRFNVTLTSNTALDQHSMSNKFSEGCDGTLSFYEVSFSCDIRDTAPKHLLQASDIYGNLGYKMLENIQPGHSYSFSFSELLEFDKTIEFKFPESNDVHLYVDGRDPDDSPYGSSYIHSFHWLKHPHTSIKAGYLNNLDRYRTDLIINYPSHKFFYSNKGSIPEENLTFPDPADFTIISKSITDFSSTSLQPYVSRKSYFYFYQTDGSGEWDMDSPTGSHKFNELPPEIVAEHPLLDFNNFKHTSTSFYIRSGDISSGISIY